MLALKLYPCVDLRDYRVLLFRRKGREYSLIYAASASRSLDLHHVDICFSLHEDLPYFAKSLEDGSTYHKKREHGQWSVIE